MSGKNRKTGLPPFELVRYALSDLGFRPLMTSLSVSTIVVAVVYALGLSFYGMSLYRYQTGLLADTLSRRVVATCTEVTDRSHRFTEEKIEEMRSDPELASVFPWRQLGVKLANGTQVFDVTAETTTAGDPAATASRLAWGGPVGTSSAREVLVSRRLLEKLGGSLGTNGPEPSQLELRVGRVTDGKPEAQSIPVRIAGVVRHGSPELVLLPLGLLDHLNMWCEHKVSSMPGPDGRPELPKLAIESAVAFGPAEAQGRIGREAAALGVSFEQTGEISVVESKGNPWARLAGLPSEATVESIRAALPRDLEFDLIRSRVLQIGPDKQGPKFVAMSADDPRWSLVPGGKAPGFGHLLSSQYAARVRASADGLELPVDGKVPEFERIGDYFCTPATLRLLTFKPSTSKTVRKMTFVETSDPGIVSRNSSSAFTELAVSDPFAWKLYVVEKPPAKGVSLGESDVKPLGDGPNDRQDQDAKAVPKLAADPATASFPDPLVEIIETVRKSYPTADIKPVYSGRIIMLSDLREIDVRFLDGGLFRHLSGLDQQSAWNDQDRDKIACIRVGPLRIDDRFADNLKIAANITGVGDNPELWFDSADRETISKHSSLTGFTLSGTWRELLRNGRIGEVESRSASVRLAGSSRAPRFSWLAPVPLGEFDSQLGKDARLCDLTPVWVLERARLSFATWERDAAAIRPDDETSALQALDGTVLTGSGYENEESLRLFELGADSPALSIRRFPRLPRGVVALPRSEFDRLAVATENAHGDRIAVGRPEFAVSTVAPRWKRLRETVEALKLGLEPLNPVSERTLIEYRVTPSKQGAQERPFDADRVKAIGMAKPTFDNALPLIQVSAFLQEQPDVSTLQGSNANDPARFRNVLKFGRWLSQDAADNEVVVPASAAHEIAEKQNEALAVGRTVTATFRKERDNGGPNSLVNLPLKVVGVVDGPLGYTSIKLAQELTLWRDGKLIYDAPRQVFESPASISIRGGWLGCNIDVRDDDSVEGVVQRLENDGYRTQHHLAEQQGLQKLGRVLITLVVLFVLGFVTSAVISVLITNAMSIAGKTHEIGILRAHGLGSAQIVSIYVVQGVVCGAAAFLCGSFLIIALEPWLTGQLKATFRIPAESIPIHLASPGNWLLFMIASIVAIAAASFGALVPALKACGLSPVQAMSRAD